MSLRKSPSGASSARQEGKSAPSANAPEDRVNAAQAPMAPAQAAELKQLAEEAFEPDAFDPSLTQAEAGERIRALKAKLRLLSEPPHTA